MSRFQHRIGECIVDFIISLLMKDTDALVKQKYLANPLRVPLPLERYGRVRKSTYRSRFFPKSEQQTQTDFGIDPVTGFLPPEPLPRLSGQYRIWENALAEAPELLRLGDDVSKEALALKKEGESWRVHVKSIAVLDIQSLANQRRLLQRAHVILSWLVQYYVHSLPPVFPPEPKKVPDSIAIPLVNVSRILGISPVITFADTVTWNWELIHSDKPVTIDNMTILHTFSGRDDERHFYQVQAAIELHGAQLLCIVESYNRTPIVDDSASMNRVAGDLERIAEIIGEFSDLIQSTRDGCDPYTFYWHIRPWFNGCDSQNGSVPGWIYEGVNPAAPELQYLCGPSGGQSTIMHTLDVFLGVNHDTPEKCSMSSERANLGFMERMRMYMLGKHREYLQHLEQSPSMRDFACRMSTLRGPYNNAVAALKKLRSLHMRIAMSYVFHPLVSKLKQPEIDRVLGTGGNKVVALLKAGVDATSQSVLKR
ncbi:Indoleamine 2,3-dioxygenase [Rhodocollybia butyracea]|uniref:Indoleamine 2,3-dioxygenase n=1 Tax=Rhodocollybia butyracea TaxID=206335 RepID=A0A9P5PLT4_9AGAR|nr:Indoleamine 2,3-dioxygenase [Rhodocollybia butyracea]